MGNVYQTYLLGANPSINMNNVHWMRGVGVVGLSPEVNKMIDEELNCLKDSLVIHEEEGLAQKLNKILEGRSQTTMNEFISALRPSIIKQAEASLISKRRMTVLFNKDPANCARKVLSLESQIAGPWMKIKDPIAKKNVRQLYQSGFNNPMLALVVSDGDSEILNLSSELKETNSSVYERMLEFAWVEQRQMLKDALKLINEYDVPAKHIRKVVSMVKNGESIGLDVEKHVLSTLKEIKINQRYWWKAFSYMIRIRNSKLIQVSNAFTKASQMGFGKNNLIFVAMIMNEIQDHNGDEIILKIVESARKEEMEYVKIGDIDNFPAGLTLHQALVYYFYVGIKKIDSSIVVHFKYRCVDIDRYMSDSKVKRDTAKSEETGAQYRFSGTGRAKKIFAEYKISDNDNLNILTLYVRQKEEIGKFLEVEVKFYEVGNDTMFISNLQCDGFRDLSDGDKENFREWEQLTLQLISEYAYFSVKKRIVIKTPYGIVGKQSTLANASAKNIIKVYYDELRKAGYEPRYLRGGSGQLRDLDIKIVDTISAPTYYMVKDVE